MGTWPSQINIELPDGYNRCFGCGLANPIGLKLKFNKTDTGVTEQFVADERYQGWPGYLHGGIVSCLLDEAMSYAAIFAGKRSLTARMEVRLKKLVPINETLIITGSVTRTTRKVIECISSVSLNDGTVVAEGKATQFIVGTSDDNKPNESFKEVKDTSFQGSGGVYQV